MEDEHFVLKIHGSIDNPDKLIFRQADYAQAHNNYSYFYQILNALLLTQTFLFLEAGLNDPDIKLLLENYVFQYPMSRKHTFVIPDNQMSMDERMVYSETFGLDFLLYDSKDNHRELTDSIKDWGTWLTHEEIYWLMCKIGNQNCNSHINIK